MSDQKSTIGRLIPYLLALCVVAFLTLAVVAIIQATLVPSQLTTSMPRPTSTVAFAAGDEVQLALSSGGSVGVWDMGSGCVLGSIRYQQNSGTYATVGEGLCYNANRDGWYHHVLCSRSDCEGWVRAEEIMLAGMFMPTPQPTGRTSARQWAGVYIGMPADDVLKIHPRSEALSAPVVVGSDPEGQIVKWTYPGAVLTLARRNGCYRVIDINLR